MLDRREMLREEAMEIELADNYTWEDAERAADKNYRWKAAPSWDRSGLHDIAEVAIADFEREAGIQLPWNLATHGPYVWSSWSKRHLMDAEGKEIVEKTARFCGWIRGAAKFPALVRLMERTTSTRGVNSPYTYLDIWKLAEHHRSPGSAARFLMKVRRRAFQIIKPYGLHVSWESLGDAMQHGSIRNIGRQARRAVAYTLKQFIEGGRNPIGYFSGKGIEVLIQARGMREFLEAPKAVQAWVMSVLNSGEFSCFREALAGAGRLQEDITDGVKIFLDPKTKKTRLGISTTLGWDNEGKKQWFVEGGEMSYHYHDYYYGEDYRKKAVKAAIEAWKKQRQLEAENREFLEALFPSDRSLLVFVSDSLNAGNCRPGTESWMRQKGLAGRKFVGVPALVKYIDDIRVRRVLQVVANRVAA